MLMEGFSMGIIDLHTHSTVSDGTYSPSGLAELAHKRGIQAFALTDHDNIGGLAEAKQTAEKLGIEFVPGMEVTMTFHGRKIHIIALGFAAESAEFQMLYKKIRSDKEDKMDDLIEGIRSRGVPITREMVQSHTTGNIDQYAVMRCLVSMRLEKKIQPLWDKYIDPVLVELGMDENISPQEAFPLIHKAGGIVSLAHFHKKIGLKGLSREEQADAIRELHQIGLDGVEKWYPSYSDDDSAFLNHVIHELNLCPTGGTDFHGLNRTGVELGTGIHGNISIPYSVLEAINKYKATEGLT